MVPYESGKFKHLQHTTIQEGIGFIVTISQVPILKIT